MVVNPHAVLTSINDLCASVDVNDASLGVLQWAECQCLKLYPFQDSLSENEVRNEERTSRASLRASLSTTRPLLPFNMVRAFNASSPCHIRTTGEILVGYIIRRMWPAAAFNEVGKCEKFIVLTALVTVTYLHIFKTISFSGKRCHYFMILLFNVGC